MTKNNTLIRKNNRVKIDLIFSICNSFSQHTKTYNMENLKSKSKLELIEIAFEILKEKQPSLVINPGDFESTTWGNSKEIIVKFRRYIRFVSINSNPYQQYDISINLITKQILPIDSIFDFAFYKPTEEDKKKVDFVNKKTNFQKQPNSEITITENEDHYWISNNSKTSLSKFFISKETGFKSGLIEGAYSLGSVQPVLESILDREEKIKLFDTDETSQKTKKEIINMALVLLKKRQPSLQIDYNDYESTILGNNKKIIVEFRRIIRYIPLNIDLKEQFAYDITVNLNSGEILPFDDFFQSGFYIETKEDKKALAFIKKNSGPFFSDFKNTINEEEEDYFVVCQNKYSLEKYLLNKKTGEKQAKLKMTLDPASKPDKAPDLDILSEIQ